jgi:hypothetical protein
MNRSVLAFSLVLFVVVAHVQAQQAETIDVTRTTWSGSENLEGFGKLAFEFLANGQAVMHDAEGISRGTWKQQGPRVTLTFADGGIVYRGGIVRVADPATGKMAYTMSGVASNTGGGIWSFSLKLNAADQAIRQIVP